MSVQFQTLNVPIPSASGRQTIERTTGFERPVRLVGLALNGFKLEFDNDDKHLTTMEVDTDIVSQSATSVRFRVQCNLADRNGDDKYSGYVNVLVIGEE